jgi:hypothetical protein
MGAMTPSRTPLRPAPAVSSTPTQPGMTPRALRAFFALASGLGWGVLAVLMLFTNQIEAIVGEISGTNPVFILAVYSPAIAAVLLVWRHYGTKGAGQLLPAGARRDQGGECHAAGSPTQAGFATLDRSTACDS